MKTEEQHQRDIRTRYRWLVRRVGRGFHPDTRGDEYTSLPDGLTPDDVDRRVAEMREIGDPYREALDALGGLHL